MRSQLLRRGASLLAVSALSITTLGALSSPASADPAGDRATGAGATWLKGQLEGGLLIGAFGPEIGPSIDAGLAFDAVGRAADATAVANGIAPNLVTTANFEYGYARSTEYNEAGEVIQVGRYANATAKAAAFATRVGIDPSTYYLDIDLIAQLEDLTDDTTGRIADDSSYDPDYANTIGQAFAAEALTAVESLEAAPATAALLQQQCAAGYFRFALGASACAEADEPDLDVTALAVLSLIETGDRSSAVFVAVEEAARWLQTQQAADGSFGDGGDQGVNANSTGLAGWALSEAGVYLAGLTDPGAPQRAASWLRGVQVADFAPCATTLTLDNGAVSPTPQALATARTAGAIPAGQRLAYAFATAQALPALAKLPAGGTLGITAPAAAVEKSTVTVTVAGLGIGEAACVGFGSVGKTVTGTGSDLTVTFDLPAGAGARTFTLTTLAGTQTATTVASLAPVPPTVPPVAPAPVTPEVGSLKTSKVEKVKKNKFKLAVTCDDTEACDGKIVVRTAGKVKVGDKKKARKVLIAKKSYSVAPGDTEKVVLKVRKPARAALDSGRIKVKAVQTAVGAERDVTKFWLREK